MRRLIILIALLVPIVAHAQWGQPNATITKYQSKDTTKVRWNLDDSSIVRTLNSGQLLELLLRNNDYGATDGIKIQTLTPDGDSTLAGVWMMGNGTLRLLSGHETKIAITPGATGAQVYGNLIASPDGGATYPLFTLKNSSNDSVYLTMAANGLHQWNRSTNLPNSWPASPATGDFGRSGNILRFQSSLGTFGFDFGTTPSVGMGWRWNGTNWAPGYPDTSGSGGGGGATRWDSIGNPGANKTFNMAGYVTQFTFGDSPGDAYSVIDNAGSSAGYLFRASTDPVSSTRKPFAALGNLNKGIEVTNAGVLQAINGGQINATQFQGSAAVAKAYLDGAVLYNDQSNTSNGNYTQTYISAGTGTVFSITNSNGGANANGLNASVSGGTGVEAHSSLGKGVFGSTGTGIGGFFKATTGGIPGRFVYNNDTVISVTSTGINPGTTGTKNLGTSSLAWGDIYGDSLFIGASNKEKMWRGDGALVNFKDTVAVFVTDTVILNWSWVDSTYNVSWNFIGRPPMLASPGGKCYNNGNVELTSSTGPMAGSYVSVRIRKRN